MKSYDHVALIYNPHSTGDAPAIANHALKDFQRHGFDVDLVPTKHAGHAIDLARDIARRYKRPLIISVSGDGGYHEVINGVMSAKHNGKAQSPVVAVIGAGNANDHRRVMRDKKPLIDLALHAEPRPLDLLKLTVKDNNTTAISYAHSYIGLGVTPAVAVELNKHQLNRLKETIIVLRAFFHYRAFEVTHQGKTKLLDSLIFANISEMAKVLKLNDDSSVRDSKFEVVEFIHKGRLHLLGLLIKAAVFGLKDQPSFKTYSIATKNAQPIQADGEILELPADAHIVVESVSDAIYSLY